jgi:hypothetical protein
MRSFVNTDFKIVFQSYVKKQMSVEVAIMTGYKTWKNMKFEKIMTMKIIFF